MGTLIVDRAVQLHPDPEFLTCLRLAGMKLGSLLNFSEAKLKDGMTRIVCGE